MGRVQGTVLILVAGGATTGDGDRALEAVGGMARAQASHRREVGGGSGLGMGLGLERGLVMDLVAVAVAAAMERADMGPVVGMVAVEVDEVVAARAHGVDGSPGSTIIMVMGLMTDQRDYCEDM